MMITTLILTYNEQICIKNAIESALKFSEVLIVDSGSSDSTLEIASSYKGVKILHNDFINFSKQRNFGISNINTEWIFILDADEVVDDKAIKWLLNHKKMECSCYKFNRKNIIWKKWLRYSTSNDYHIRLFSRNADVEYSGNVHEFLNTNLIIENAQGNIIHNTNIDAEILFSKQNFYSNLYAREENISSFKFFLLLIKPLFSFFKILILKRGILDGWRGVAWAYSASSADIMNIVKIIEKNY